MDKEISVRLIYRKRGEIRLAINNRCYRVAMARIRELARILATENNTSVADEKEKLCSEFEIDQI